MIGAEPKREEGLYMKYFVFKLKDVFHTEKLIELLKSYPTFIFGEELAVQLLKARKKN